MLKPFIPDMIPSVADVDAMLKVVLLSDCHKCCLFDNPLSAFYYMMLCYIHRVSKNVPIIFCSLLVKYEPISAKIGRHFLPETLDKTV